MVEIELYHTCRDEGSSDADILAAAPFKAEAGKPQWLGVGYYFWVESLKQAQSWGKHSPAYYPQGYLVIRYLLNLNRDDLLDLVGSPRDQEGFAGLFGEIAQCLGRSKHKLTVSACIEWLQKNKRFEWLAVKLADYGPRDRLMGKATYVLDGRVEAAFLRPRIQLCLYPGPSDNNTGVVLSCKGNVERGQSHYRPKRKPIFDRYK